MMRAAVSRRAATSGGFGVSFGVHAALLLLLLFMMRIGATGVSEMVDELTEIAYIESRYGEDVAEKVRLKTRPAPAPVERKAEPEKAVDDSHVESKPVLKQRTLPMTKPVLKRQKMRMDVKTPDLKMATEPRTQLQTASRLNSRRFADTQAPVAGLENLRNKQALAADVGAPALSSRQPQAKFNADTQSLVGRKSKLNLDEVDFEVGEGGGSGRMALQLPSGGVEGGNAGLVGGQLEEGKEVYQGTVSSLIPARGFKKEARQAPAEVDIAAAATAAGGNRTGRRTILDYGAGGGGGSGALSGRKSSLKEAPSAGPIVEKAASADSRSAPVEAAAALGGNGVSMTVSGQIVGRDILHAPQLEYTETARRNGWEGVVAVHFTVMPDGRVKDNLYFDQTAAHRDLNRSAMAAIREFRFEPLPDGQPKTEQWGVITIVFRLN